jgi:hypothetical protein
MDDPHCAIARLELILRRPLSAHEVRFSPQALGMVPVPCGSVKTDRTD